MLLVEKPRTNNYDWYNLTQWRNSFLESKEVLKRYKFVIIRNNKYKKYRNREIQDVFDEAYKIKLVKDKLKLINNDFI